MKDIVTQGICPITNKHGRLLFSNNPMTPAVSIQHLESTLDHWNLEHADMFCRTFNFPFHPEQWLVSAAQKDMSPYEHYVRYFVQSHQDNLYYTTSTKDVWRDANAEWEKAMTHRELLESIAPIKEEFIRRGKITWGTRFTFEELIKLESQFKATIDTFDINNPMQLDAVRKSCITSVMMDQLLTSGGDPKDLKELTNTHAQLLKMAKIDEMLESSQSDVMRTVADLAKYLEDNGFEFEFFDNYDRDIVDKTIRDLKEHLTTLVTDSTGLDVTLEAMMEKIDADKQDEAFSEAVSKISLEDLAAEIRQEEEDEINSALESESILGDDDDYYDDYGDDDDEFF